MPRFHFHLKDGKDWPDPEGTELSCAKEARSQALQHAGEMLKDNAISGHFDREWQMRVTDERGLTLLQLDFAMTETPAMRTAH